MAAILLDNTAHFHPRFDLILPVFILNLRPHTIRNLCLPLSPPKKILPSPRSRHGAPLHPTAAGNFTSCQRLASHSRGHTQIGGSPNRKTPPLHFHFNSKFLLKQEESRLRAKDLRSQREAAARASGTERPVAKSSSGFVDTEDVHVVAPGKRSLRKRPYESITQSHVPETNRDARSTAKRQDVGGSSSAGGAGANADGSVPRAANKKFARFVDYNFSNMTDTKGGFLSTEDDPFNKSLGGGGGGPGQGPGANPDEPQRPKHMTEAEWERMQLLRKLQRQKAGPFEPGLSAIADKAERKKCRECGSPEIDWVWEETFGCCVCGGCKEKFPEKYSLLTKTECREDYLITDRKLPALQAHSPSVIAQ